MTTLTKPTARAASTPLTFEHASDLATSTDDTIKRMCDTFTALFSIIPLTPLSIIVVAMVRLNDGGPAFFTQERIGLNGKLITMLKFRTMRVDAEDLKVSLMEANEADSSADILSCLKWPTIRALRASEPSCARRRSTSCPSCSTSCVATCPSWARAPLPSEVAQYEPRVMGKFAVRPGLVDAPLSGPQREKTTVRLPFMRTRRSA